MELGVVDTVSEDTVGRVLKKRAQAVARRPLVHSGSERRLRMSDGSGA